MEFPPTWDFLLEADLPGYKGGSDEQPTNMEVLLEMCETNGGAFRILYNGHTPVEASFRAERLFGPEFEGEAVFETTIIMWRS
jgi:hypothetical protein